MKLIGREDLAQDAEFASNDGRVRRVDELDQAIGVWASQISVEQALEALDQASVPAGKIFTIEDIAKDPHYHARGMIETIRMKDGSELQVPGIIPKLSRTPGSMKTLAPDVGEQTDQILQEIGLSSQQIAALKDKGIAFTH
jgi:formyl-CoA transferase